MTLVKIISGAQTGADQAGLFAAEALGLKTGGWIPKGYRTESGPRPDLAERFALIEHSSANYAGRTLTNILMSDGTLIFGNPYSPGSRLTRQYTLNNAPCYIVTWAKPKQIILDNKFLRFIKDNRIKVLNVAGNRESKNPGIFAAAKAFLILNLKELK